jgi:hypothetical protein
MCAGMASADEPAAENRQRRIHELVEALATSDSMPKLEERRSGNAYLVFSKTPDWKRYEQVGKVADELRSMGIDAFSELVAHATDSRFCCVVQGCEVDEWHSVGWACREILRCQVEVYPYEVLGKLDDIYRPTLIGDFDKPGRQSLTEWWRRDHRKSLRELQISAAEYVLGATRRWNGPNGYDDAEQREAFRKIRARNIKHLEEFIAKLKKSKKPEPAAGLGWRIVAKRGGKENEMPIYFGK